MEKPIQEQLEELKKNHAKAIGDIHEADAKDAELLESLKAKLKPEPEPIVIPRVIETPTDTEPKSWIQLENEKFEASKLADASKPIVVASPDPEPLPVPEPETIPEGSFRAPEDTKDKPVELQYDAYKSSLLYKNSATGLNTIFDTLEHQSEFLNLSQGKKMLVVQSLMEDIYSKVKRDAKDTFQKESSAPSAWMNTVPVIGGVAKKIKSALYGLNKNALTQKYEKKAIGDLTYFSDGEYVNKQGMKYIKSFAEQDLDAVYAGRGKVQIDFAKINRYGESEVAEKYNEAANVLAHIPQEWSIRETATKEEYRQWKNAARNFAKAERDMIPEFRNRAANMYIRSEAKAESEGAMDANFARRQVELMSFVSKNPDTAEALRKIATSDAVSRTVDSLKKFGSSYANLSRITSLVTGAGVRVGVGAGVGAALSGTALGGAMIAGAPIIAGTLAAIAAGGTVGYFFRGEKKAKDKFKEQTKEARNTELALNARKTQPGTLKSLSRITRRTEQLQKITKQLSDLSAQGGRPVEIALLQNQLKTHLYYIEDKIEKGEMNFGDADSQYTNHVNLMMAKQDADIALEMFKGIEDPEWQARFDELINHSRDTDAERRNDWLDKSRIMDEKVVALAQKEAIRVQKWESARIGAAFGTIGAIASQFFYSTDAGHAVHEVMHGVTGAVKGGIKHVADTIHHTEPVVANSGGTGLIGKGLGAEGLTSRLPNLHETIHHTPTTSTPGGAEAVPTKIHHADVEHTLSKAIIKKGDGVGDALLKLRNSPSFKELIKTNPKVAKFFQGNIWDEAKALHAFRPGDANGDSLIVGEGSEIGITSEGDIYLTNTLGGGHTDIIGHIDPATGKFTEVTPGKDFDYGHKPGEQRTKIAEQTAKPSHKNYPKSGDEAPEAKHPKVRNEDEIEEVVTQKTTHPKVRNEDEIEEIETNPDHSKYPVSGDEAPEIKTGAVPKVEVSKQIENFTRRDWIRVDNIVHRNMTDDLNHAFGKKNFLGVLTHSGEKSKIWESLSERTSASIFKQPLADFKQQPATFSFMRHVRLLAQEHPEIPQNGKFGEYYSKLVEADAKEFVATHPNIDPK